MSTDRKGNTGLDNIFFFSVTKFPFFLLKNWNMKCSKEFFDSRKLYKKQSKTVMEKYLYVFKHGTFSHPGVIGLFRNETTKMFIVNIKLIYYRLLSVTGKTKEQFLF